MLDIELLLKDAKKSDFNAAKKLCDIAYKFQKGKGVPKDEKKAFEIYYSLSKIGYARAQNNLGSCYRYGRGTNKNNEEAFYWYDKSAAQGDDIAMDNLGSCYKLGIGVEENAKEAVYWYKKSAERNNSYAKYNLGMCYLNGYGIEYEVRTAVAWFERAAKQNNDYAKIVIGKIFFEGDGIEKDVNKAKEFFENVSEDKYGDASYYLGCYYYDEKNYKKARNYFVKAFSKGYSCKLLLNICESKLNKKTESEEVFTNIITNYEKLTSKELFRKVELLLKKEFENSWNKLHDDVKAALTSSMISYIQYKSLGCETYDNLDFTPVIVGVSKALEIVLSELFYSNYIDYLVKHNIPPETFNHNRVCLVKSSKGKIKYNKREQKKNFNLASFEYIIKIQKNENGKLDADKHFISYAKNLFNEYDIRYIREISEEISVIREVRNSSCHFEIKKCEDAEQCLKHIIFEDKLIRKIVDAVDFVFLKTNRITTSNISKSC